MRYFSYFILPLLFVAQATAGDLIDQMVDPEDGWLDASSWLLDNAHGFFPVPIIITEPSVGYGAGMAAVFFHETPEQKSNRLRRESGEAIPPAGIPKRLSFAAAMATQNGTNAFGGGHFGSYVDDRLRYTGAYMDADVNMDFYLPLENIDDVPLGFNLQVNLAYQDVKWRVADSPFFVGAKLILMKTDILLENLADLDLGDVPSEWILQESSSSGIGLSLSYDSRDTLWGQETGNESLLEIIDFDEKEASMGDFQKFKFYSHQYLVLNPQWFLGLRMDYQQVKGDMFFYQLPYISLMGIPVMRYQGESVAVLEANLRWQLHSRWSVLGFGGVGRAADNIGDLSSAISRSSYGVGFRYLMAKKLRLYTGLDIAWGPETSAFYFKMGLGW